jgi:hypothetical protein
MSSLKEALLKVGIKPINQENIRKKPQTKKEGHQQFRNFCEHCSNICPDVEKYNHSNRLLEKKFWLCIKCADDFKVLDEQRMTNQSESARKGLFRRYFGGKLKKFDPIKKTL